MAYRIPLIGIVFTALTVCAPALAQEGELTRPAYDIGQRQNEDWSVLAGRDTAATGDWFDRLKYIPLSEDGSVWLSFGGHGRLRLEAWENFGFTAASDETFLLSRLLLHGDLHVGEHVRVFAEGITAHATERDLPGGRRALDVNALDLQQGFVDVTLPLDGAGSLTVRGGRQTLKFGDQRLVSPLPWANTMRSWDGVSLIWSMEHCTVTGFYTQFAPVEKYDFDDPSDDAGFYGVYATGELAETPVHADLYWLGLSRDGVTFNGTTGNEDRQTLGGRVYGEVGQSGLDFDVEGVFQFGEVGGGDVAAFMVAAELGYRFAEQAASPRVWVGFDYASGDDAAGGDVETFNQLFPLGHAYFGYIDAVGRQNVIDAQVGVSATPVERLELRLAGHFFWRAADDDALYNAGGGVVRAAGGSGSARIGQEIDLTAKYAIDRHWSLLLGYSHFFAGDFIDDTGAAEDIDFAYSQVQFTF